MNTTSKNASLVRMLKLKELRTKFPTKKLLYYHLRDVRKSYSPLTDPGNYVLPSLRHATIQYLQDILCGRKKFLVQGNAIILKKAPKWPEVSAKRLMPVIC